MRLSVIICRVLHGSSQTFKGLAIHAKGGLKSQSVATVAMRFRRWRFPATQRICKQRLSLPRSAGESHADPGRFFCTAHGSHMKKPNSVKTSNVREKSKDTFVLVGVVNPPPQHETTPSDPLTSENFNNEGDFPALIRVEATAEVKRGGSVSLHGDNLAGSWTWKLQACN